MFQQLQKDMNENITKCIKQQTKQRLKTEELYSRKTKTKKAKVKKWYKW